MLMGNLIKLTNADQDNKTHDRNSQSEYHLYMKVAVLS